MFCNRHFTSSTAFSGHQFYLQHPHTNDDRLGDNMEVRYNSQHQNICDRHKTNTLHTNICGSRQAVVTLVCQSRQSWITPGRACAQQRSCSNTRTHISAVVSIIAVLFLFLHLPRYSTAAGDFTFPDLTQAKFAQDLKQFHISRPSRVDHLGDFLASDVHLDRHKRAAHESDGQTDHLKRTIHTNSLDRSFSEHSEHTISADAHLDKNAVRHLKIPLHPERDVIVRVSQNHVLLSPSAILETKISKFKNISDSIFTTLKHHHGCHYTGHVMGEDNSRVALSACGGLRGYLRLKHDEYIIEPVKGFNLSHEGQPHLVYKRSALPDSSHTSVHQDTPACGVAETYDRVMQQRDRWERHKRGMARRTKNEPESEHRRKRSISIEKYVETLVVVDTDMVNYYENEDIETYVLTVMNMVAALFHDATIGNSINIVIVRILLMQDPDEELHITHHADKTLKSFCKWQKGINFRDDDHPNHHDVAVLMTRRNICSRNNEPCGTLGLAQVAGLCQPHRSCSINEDTGLSLAWTVAHELGHNFGMKHDNQQNDCLPDQQHVQYVMAPHLTWDKTPSAWSNCSRAAITKFLDRNWGYCLDDLPGKHDFKYPVLPAGTMYDADHQCRLLYGAGAERCSTVEELENICTTLWCRLDNKCSTKLQPAAVGTICGVDKWCFAGRCVDIGERPQAINGQWGEWAGWTECTRTCGAGVSVSQRHCNHPAPSNGGRYCTGERKRYRICNTDDCPEGGPSFRSQQCSEFNEIPYKGKVYQWEPVPTPETPCQLHCKPQDLLFSVLLKDVATDGTPCVLGSRHMCISGVCRHIGCDWIIDSGAVEDRCGVCFGDSSTCQTIKHQFNETKVRGYVEAAVLPAGSRNIRVEEVAEASNFLALKNDAGKFYLNGHWYIQWSGDYEVGGTIFHYKREGNKETFLAPGPLKEPLHVMLLMQTDNPGLEYEYTVPRENVTSNRKLEFSWDYTDWSHCTVTCGGGTQRSSAVCKELEAGLVDETHCDQSTKPDDQMRACNLHICPARWWTGPWQHCSVTCGEDGTHQRTVICIRSLGVDEQIALDDQACEGLSKPLEVEPCQRTEPCPNVGVWLAGEWSHCNKPCDGGLQFRNVTCEGGSNCNEIQPDSEQACNEQMCKDHLQADTLTNTQDMNNQSNSVNMSDFIISLFPSSSKSNASESNSTALPGDVNKNILISNLSISELMEINKDFTVNQNVPINQDVHINQDVPIKAAEGNNESHDLRINESKLKSVQSLIHNPVSPSMTDNRDKHSQSDNAAMIGESQQNSSLQNKVDESDGTFHYSWKIFNWSKCSSVCGQGVQTRDVLCVEAKSESEVTSNLCDFASKPTAINECFEYVCASWQTSDWSQCSASCGHGTQLRHVTCPSPGQCDPTQKPESVRMCEDHVPCITWIYGDWSQCTKSCGIGSQERLVQCVNQTSQQLSDSCPLDVKPVERQDCNSHDCPAEDNAALTVACESNEMSFKVCQMLKKVGLCHKQYVQAKCCRTCHKDERPKPDEPRLS